MPAHELSSLELAQRHLQLVQALLHWGMEAGATSAYLQVRAQNTPALRLYESMGFKTAYGYHYRVPG